MTATHREPRSLVSVLSRLANALLSVGAVVGTICVIVALVGAILDLRTLVFRSGSMSPEISAGALAFAKETPARELAVGDVVSVVSSNDIRVTHRVQNLTMAGQTAQLTLKGDANSRPDAETYSVDSADRVVFDLPYAGYAIGYATSPVGIFLGGVVAAGLLWLIFRPPGPPSGQGTAARRGARRAGAAGAAMVIATTIVVSQAPISTLASFSDVGTVASGGLAAHKVAAQAQPKCENVNEFLTFGNVASLTWTNVDARYEYYWQLRRPDSSVVSSGVVGSGQTTGSAVTLTIGTGLISVNGNYTVGVRARLRNSTSWVAGSETTTPVHRTSLLIIGLSMRCGAV